MKLNTTCPDEGQYVNWWFLQARVGSLVSGWVAVTQLPLRAQAALRKSSSRGTALHPQDWTSPPCARWAQNMVKPCWLSSPHLRNAHSRSPAPLLRPLPQQDKSYTSRYLQHKIILFAKHTSGHSIPCRYLSASRHLSTPLAFPPSPFNDFYEWHLTWKLYVGKLHAWNLLCADGS